jgi:hypothetical protein
MPYYTVNTLLFAYFLIITGTIMLTTALVAKDKLSNGVAIALIVGGALFLLIGFLAIFNY